eukprot:GHVS01077024.1.p1 GENE.GHVS01077024.1~~GHVS01077024.1.p1  ORF type:complete len:293 (-),score=43.44 GHVS01077024.1:167-1045(-)
MWRCQRQPHVSWKCAGWREWFFKTTTRPADYSVGIAECGGCGCSGGGRAKQCRPTRHEGCGCDDHCDHSHDTTAVLRNPNNMGHSCGGTHAKSDSISAGGTDLTCQHRHCCREESAVLPGGGSLQEKDGVKKLKGLLIKLASPAFFVSLALATHSVFEGVVVGTAHTVLDVWVTTLVIVGHKGAAGFALSVVFVRQQLCRGHCGLFLGIFLLASPVGIFMGTLAQAGGHTAAGVMTSLSIGTVLYVANEVIVAELASGGATLIRWLKFSGFILGGSVVFCLTLVHFAVGHEG